MCMPASIQPFFYSVRVLASVYHWVRMIDLTWCVYRGAGVAIVPWKFVEHIKEIYALFIIVVCNVYIACEFMVHSLRRCVI